MDDFEKEILRLRQVYEDAETVILRQIRQLDALPYSDDRAKRLERVAALEKETKAEIAQLTKTATAWTKTNIDKAYRAGLKEEQADIKAVTGQVVAGFGKYHSAAVATLKDQMLDRVGDVSTKMGRQTVNVYGEAKLGINMFETLAGTESVSKLARRLRDDMLDKGITGFIAKDYVDKNDVAHKGAHWKVSTYAEMLARTSVMNAMLTAKTTELQARGHDLVRVSRHLGAEGSDHDCELCRQWEGKILSITGATKGFPTIKEARDDGLFHPNCKHSVHLWVDYDEEDENEEEEAAQTDVEEPNAGLREWLEKLGKSLSSGTGEVDPDWIAKVDERILGGITNESDVIDVGKVAYKHLLKTVEDAPLGEAIADSLLQEISKYRSMGGELQVSESSDIHARDSIIEASKYLPVDWVNRINQTGGIFGVNAQTGVDRERGKYNPTMRTITVDQGGYQTALHELGHAVEEKLTIRILEQEFFERRTRGSDPQKLSKMTGYSEYRDEMAKEGGFVDAYIGKVYKNAGYEILSMGLECVYYNDFDAWRRDPEYVQFILGLLLGV